MDDRQPQFLITRRTMLEGSAALAVTGLIGTGSVPAEAEAASAPPLGSAPLPLATPPLTSMPVTLNVNGAPRSLSLDPRTTLLDTLREHIGLTGSKKGCDHGQCGACTILVNGRRINSCLTLAVMHDGDEITTIEGLAKGDDLHPLQAAFVHHDGFQCGYCTAGQICSAAGMLHEHKAGMPSHVTDDLIGPAALSDAEIRERMSGNICRCAAYPNIVAAIKDAGAVL